MKIKFFYEKPVPSSHPDMVTCVVICPGMKDGGWLEYRGHAYCHPSDPFNKEYGRKLALKRAISTLPREQRAQIWERYHSRRLSG